jgi:hypothetical protein
MQMMAVHRKPKPRSESGAGPWDRASGCVFPLIDSTKKLPDNSVVQGSGNGDAVSQATNGLPWQLHRNGFARVGLK